MTVIFCLVQALTAAGASSEFFAQALHEYQIKAAFLYNFAQFVEWPAAMPKEAPFVIGILGQDPFREQIDWLMNERVNERPILVRRFRAPEQIRQNCDILFVNARQYPDLPSVFEKLSRETILTVGDTVRFAEQGGAIGFILRHNRVRFVINRRTAEEKGLKISSQLLALADKVI